MIKKPVVYCHYCRLPADIHSTGCPAGDQAKIDRYETGYRDGLLGKPVSSEDDSYTLGHYWGRRDREDPP